MIKRQNPYDDPEWMAKVHAVQPAQNIDIRTWMATKFMAAMLTNPELDPQQMPKRAIQMANSLVRELDRELEKDEKYREPIS